MFFSVIIPTCNRNEMLALCLDRLAPGKQTLDASLYEVIITDDGKNNEAKELVYKNYSWAKWMEGPKKGPAANRNNGFKYASGKWIIFLDDDCIPVDNLLSAYYNACNESQFLVFEGCIINPGPTNDPLDYAPVNKEGGNLWSCNFCINRDLLNYLAGFDEKFKYPHMEDNDLKKRICDNNYNINFIPEALVIHPWRKLENGYKLGRYQEMYVYFCSKHHLSFNLTGLLKSVFFTHFQMMRDKPLSSNHLKAILFTLQHLFVVMFNFNKWKKKYVG